MFIAPIFDYAYVTANFKAANNSASELLGAVTLSKMYLIALERYIP